MVVPDPSHYAWISTLQNYYSWIGLCQFILQKMKISNLTDTHVYIYIHTYTLQKDENKQSFKKHLMNQVAK